MARRKTVVGTQVVRMMEDEKLPNSLIQGLTQGIFGTDGDIPTDVMEALFKSVGLTAENLYRYAEEGHYPHGLPSGNFRVLSQARAKVETVLSQIEGQAVQLEYVRLGPPNLIHMAWIDLVNNHDYNPTTNRLPNLTVHNGDEVYLSDMVAHVPKDTINDYRSGILETWGIPPNAGETPFRFSGYVGSHSLRSASPVVADSNATSEFIRVSYEYPRLLQEGHWDDPELPGSKVEGYFDMPAGTADEASEYFQASYSVNGVRKWWMYRVGAGTYPTLDELALVEAEEFGTYFPFAYFRYDKKNEQDNPVASEYEAVKQMVNKIGLNYDQIAESINENPDIADVIQAMMVFGVPPETEEEIEREYLFKYFSNLYDMQDPQYRSTVWNTAQLGRLQAGRGSVTDGWNNAVMDIADKRFRMRLIAKNINRTYGSGNIAKVNEHSSGKGVSQEVFIYRDEEFGQEVEGTYEVPYYYYQKQLTEGLYEELRVYGLEMEYYIQGSHHTTSDEIDNILLIPIDRAICRHWSLPRKELLFSRSLHFIFNSLKVIKVRWYQRGIFRLFLIIAALVISIAIQGVDGGAILGSVLTAAGGSVIVAVIIQTVINFVMSIVMGELMKVLARAIGGELALLLAVAAAAYGMYHYVNTGTMLKIPWAGDLLSIANSLIGAGMGEMMRELQNDYSNFLREAEEAMDLLNEARSLLEEKHHLSPFILFGESPSDFYNRTVHSGNTGILCFSAISSYTEIALKLPEFNDTVGETFYGNEQFIQSE